jgi:transcriptional regulator with XRE-family HTH domain
MTQETALPVSVGLPDKRCTEKASHGRPAGRTVVDVDNRAEVREFLVSRRAKITPQLAGLPVVGTRRVPGLRRGEVAALAGVSIEYYSKLERGALAGVSSSVLDAIARALQLDDAERAHALDLLASWTASQIEETQTAT